MFLLNLRIAFKNLLKFPFLTVLKVLGMSIALLSVLFICLWLRDELSYDRHLPQAERLYRLTIRVDDAEQNIHSHFARCYQPWLQNLKDNFPEIESVIRISRMSNYVVKAGDNQFYARFNEVDSSFLSVFNIQMLAGDRHSALAKPGSIILSRSSAQIYFGTTDPLGKTVLLYCLNCSEKKEYQVTGIFQDIPPTSHFHTDMMAPFEYLPDLDPWAYYYLLLKPGNSPNDLLAKLPAYIKEKAGEHEAKTSTCELQKVSDIHLRSSKDREMENNSSLTSIWIFAGIAVFIMIISLINFFNLRLAGIINNQRTYLIMKTFGAGKKHVLGLITSEAFILNLLSINLALVGLETLLPKFGEFAGKTFLIRSPADYIFIALVSLALFSISMLCGILPSAMLHRGNSRLRRSNSSGSSLPVAGIQGRFHFRIMKILIILQFTAAIMLISGAIAVNKQVQYFMDKRLGGDSSNILCIQNLPVQIVDNYRVFKDELLKNPLIKGVTSTFEDPADEALDKMPFETEGIRDDVKNKYLNVYPCDDNFFSFYSIPFIAGGNFPSYTGNDSLPESYILNESALRVLGWKPEEAIGKPFRMIANYGAGDLFNGGHIIGIVKDFQAGSAKSKTEPTVYFQKKFWLFSCQVRIDTAERKQALIYLAQTWQRLYADYPFTYTWVNNLYRNIYRQEIRQQQLLVLFTLLAILISSMGLWSICSLITRQRTREIGIRKTNGASTLEIMGMFNKEFAFLVIIAVCISTPLEWVLINRWLQNYVNRIEPGIWVYALPAAIALLTALLTISVQTFRIAIMNPVEALRYE
jgi:putative ABC transport system permease protein